MIISNDIRAKYLRSLVVIAASIAIPSASLSMASCAEADADTPENDAASNPIPGEAGSGDPEGGGAEADAPSLPCAVGNLCSVPTPLTIGSVAALSGRSKNDVWASGSRGVLMHWSGQAWAKLESEGVDTFSSLVPTPDEMWGVAGNLVVRRGTEASSVRQRRFNDAPRSRSLTGLAVLPNGDALVGLTSGKDENNQCLAKITDFDAGVLGLEPNPVPPGATEPRCITTRAFFLVPDKALWLVGERGGVVRYPVSPLGAGVVVPVATQAMLLAAWGEGEQLWASGSGGTILHFDGTLWRTETTGTRVTLNAIFGLSPKDIWAAGEQGTVLHFDGNQWSRVDIGNYRGKLEAIWGASTDDIWIGGENAMFHWGALP